MLKKRIIAILTVTVMLMTVAFTALAAWEEDTETAPVVIETVITDDGTTVSGEVPTGTEGVDEWRLVDTETETGAIYGDELEIVGYEPDLEKPIYTEKVFVGYEPGEPIYDDVVVRDEDGNPVIATDENGNELFNTELLFDENDEPIMREPVQATDEDGNLLFEDDTTKPIYAEAAITPDIDGTGYNTMGTSNGHPENGVKFNETANIEAFKALKNVNFNITGSGNNAAIFVPEGVTVIVYYESSKGGGHYVEISGEKTFNPDANGTNSFVVDAWSNVTYEQKPVMISEQDYQLVPIYATEYIIIGYEDDLSKPIYIGGELVGYEQKPIYDRPIIGYWEVINETYARFIWVDEAGAPIIPAGPPPVVPAALVLPPADGGGDEADIVEVEDIIAPLVNIEEEEEADEAAPIVDVGDIDTPLSAPMNITPAAGNTNSWHLWNLIFSAATVVLALAMGIRAIAGNKKEDEDKYEANTDARKKRLLLSLAIPVSAIIACIVFFLTQDLTAPMAMVDMWTIAHVGLFAAALMSFIFADRKVDNEEKVQA